MYRNLTLSRTQMTLRLLDAMKAPGVPFLWRLAEEWLDIGCDVTTCLVLQA